MAVATNPYRRPFGKRWKRSSLGKLRYAALVNVTGERKDKLSLIDIKEAAASAAPTACVAEIPADYAMRVVGAGAKASGDGRLSDLG